MPIKKSTAKKILKEAGAKRVSDSAALEFAEMVTRFAYSTAKKAVDLAAHAKRGTVQKEDLELAR